MLTRLCVTVFTGKPGSILHVPFIHNARNANLRIGGIQNISFDTIKYYRVSNKTPHRCVGTLDKGVGGLPFTHSLSAAPDKVCRLCGHMASGGAMRARAAAPGCGHDLHSRALFGARVAIPGHLKTTVSCCTGSSAPRTSLV